MSIHICFLALSPERAWDNIPVATSSLGIQILVSNTILLQKEAGILEEMADSRTGAGHIQGEIRASCSAIK